MRGIVALALLVAACGRMRFEAQRSPSDATTDVQTLDVRAPGWTSITAGDQTTCGIADDRAYCWGDSSAGQIGDGGTANRSSPTEVALPAGIVSLVALGERHGCAVLDGAAYCWGSAPPGNGAPSSATPVAVSGLPSPVTSIACGGDFTCATAGGGAYCWGVDNNGALGNGAPSATVLTPGMVLLPAGAVSIDVGNDHAIALLADATVWAWGHNDGGTLGTGSTSPSIDDTPVLSLAATAQPSIGGWHACNVAGGAARCWGTGTSGELGDGLATDTPSPVDVSGMSSGVTMIVTGGGPADGDSTCAVMAGEVWCWGNGQYGRNGNSSTTDQLVPAHVAGLATDVVDVALGFDHACARSDAGIVRCWGRGDAGQLGDGASTSSMSPVMVPLP